MAEYEEKKKYLFEYHSSKELTIRFDSNCQIRMRTKCQMKRTIHGARV